MTPPRDLALPAGYSDLLEQLKDQSGAARTKALRTVNTQLLELHRSIGRDILGRGGEFVPGDHRINNVCGGID